jgi:intraflagellar transport protein 122
MGLLLGLKNGQVLKIYVDNLFPIPVVTHERAIRCLDLSASRRRLALVDQFANVVVYDMNTQASA